MEYLSSYVLNAIFIISFLVSILNLFHIVSIIAGHPISYPEVFGISIGSQWVMYSSFLYQIYYWATQWGLLL